MKNLNEIELVIVDNKSKDSSIDIIESYEKEINIKLIKNDINKGFAEACNTAAKISKGKYIFITNQDVIFPSDIFIRLKKIYNNLKNDLEIVISPALIFENGTIHYFGAKIHFLGFSYTPELGEKLPKKRIIKKTERFSGGGSFMKKDFFLEMGGFDESFFMYYEDTDLSLKMLRIGHKIYTTNDTFLIHQKNYQTLNDSQYFFLERNRFIVLVKNFDNIRKLIPFIIIIEIILLFHSILIRKFKLRIKIYIDILSKIKYLENLRERSKKESSLLSYKNLSKKLDPILLWKLRNVNGLRRLLKILNIIL